MSQVLKSAIFLGVGIFALVACGSGGSATTDDGLRTRAVSAFQVVSSERWAEFHASYFSPESKAACPGTTFALTAELAMTTIKALMGLKDADTLEIVVPLVLSMPQSIGQLTSGYIVFNEHTFVEPKTRSHMTLCKNSVCILWPDRVAETN